MEENNDDNDVIEKFLNSNFGNGKDWREKLHTVEQEFNTKSSNILKTKVCFINY